MRRAITLIFALNTVMVGSVGHAQVDTLGLTEIVRITLPQNITNLYVQDLDGDSLQEIILTDLSYIYVYENPTYNLMWQSPPMYKPGSLRFTNYGYDSFFDIFAKDDSNIFLFSPLDSTIIWTSTTYHNSTFIFSSGYIDTDQFIDLCLAKKYPVNEHGGFDTVVVTKYYGPDFEPADSIVFTMVDYYDNNGYVRENLSKLEIGDISSRTGPVRFITLLSSWSSSYQDQYYYSYEWKGYIRQYDANSFNPRFMSMSNSPQFSIITNNADNQRILILMSLYRYFSIGPHGYFRDITKNMVLAFDADTLLYCDTIEIRSGFGFSDIVESNPGLELYYGPNDLLVVRSIQNRNNIWAVPNANNPIKGIYHSSDFSSNPFIVLRNDHDLFYLFHEPNSGILRFALHSHDSNLRAMNDLDNDGRDELLFYTGNIFVAYSVSVVTSILDPPQYPTTFSLSAAYPNPFNSQTILRYSLPKPEPVRLSIYDILGRKISSLVDQRQDAGEYSLNWNATGFPSGVYFARLEGSGTSQIIKMLLIK